MSTNKEVTNFLNQWVKSTPKVLPSEDTYSSDDLIDAFLTGTKVGADREMRLIKDKFKTNIGLISVYAHELFEYLKDNGFGPISSYLKINNFDSYNLLFTIPDTKFLDSKILELYDYFYTFQDDKLDEFFSFSVSLCGATENLNESKIASDGFAYKLR